MKNWAVVAQTITDETNEPFTVDSTQEIKGGCINTTKILIGQNQRYFVKLNDANFLPLFEAEADGLRELARTKALKVPEPICFGVDDSGAAFLVLEFLELKNVRDSVSERLGLGLAQIHQTIKPDYGWHRDNAIGATRQINTRSDNWVEFWRNERLGYQLDLAVSNGYGRRLEPDGRSLLENLPAFFAGYSPIASLLHGDLWSGNVAATRMNEPVIFDPAVYFGDHEVDLAMTELFGGFGSRFYAAYQDVWPLDSGYEVRKNLYNLYHVLNHLNLFGTRYLTQAENTIQKLLSETK